MPKAGKETPTDKSGTQTYSFCLPLMSCNWISSSIYKKVLPYTEEKPILLYI